MKNICEASKVTAENFPTFELWKILTYMIKIIFITNQKNVLRSLGQ
jgi:hypothetical protein